MTLIEATATHLAPMAELDRQVAPHPWTAALFGEEKEAGALILVGVDGGGCVVAYGVIRPMVEEWHLMTVGVALPYQRQGWGRLLTCALLDGAAQLGGVRAILEVAVANEAACRLYKAIGFTQIGRRKGYYQPGMDALVMACPLPLGE